MRIGLYFATTCHRACSLDLRSDHDGVLVKELAPGSKRVAIIRDPGLYGIWGEQTTVTMASDDQDDPKEFALVISVPTVVRKERVKVLDSTLVDHLDAYSAPRLVEYFDTDPMSATDVKHRDCGGAPSGSIRRHPSSRPCCTIGRAACGLPRTSRATSTSDRR